MDVETKVEIIIIVVLFCVISVVFGIAGVIFYYLANFFIRKLKLTSRYLNKKNLALIISAAVFLSAFYFSYTAVYPTDDFYYEEFEYVTLEKIPPSAKIISKDSSYPDLHGDYFSKSTIQLSRDDFQKLLNKLNSEKKLNKQPVQTKNEIAIFQRNIEGESDRFLFITFLADRKTIEVWVEFT